MFFLKNYFWKLNRKVFVVQLQGKYGIFALN